jgi:hypothetical protein
VAKLNTKLESEGAEFEGIPTYKAYSYQKGFDLVATWPEKKRSARIQVKCRYASDAGHFLINSFDCEFVVLVALNREYRYQKKKRGDIGTNVPEYFVFTAQEAQEFSQTKTGWGKIPWKKQEFSKFSGRWKIIKDFGSANFKD